MLTYDLAGIAFELRVPEPIRSELAARYAGYETDRAPEVVCESEVGGDFLPQAENLDYPAALVACEGPRYRFQRSDMDARFDVSTGALAVRTKPAAFSLESSLRIAVSLLLPRRGGLLLHSSGVVEEERGYVFSAKSGTGKTTMVRLLAPRRPLGDDLVALLPAAGGAHFEAMSTPFAGEYGVVAPRRAPLARLHFLEQAPAHELLAMSPTLARTRILANTLAYVREVETARLLQDAAAHLARTTPAMHLRFARDPSVAAVLFPPA